MAYKKALFLAAGIVIIIVGLFLLPKTSGSNELDGFAQCINESGATFYGAWWCPHCQAQKKMFSNSASLLPYVECSTPDGNSQLPVCSEKGISNYPTWEFADGERLVGEIPLSTLAERTGCELPQGN
jgi:thiol-disulfide isomerase/thioredoxin